VLLQRPDSGSIPTGQANEVHRKMAGKPVGNRLLIRQKRQNIAAKRVRNVWKFSELKPSGAESEDYSSLSTQYPLPGVFAS
jgi:hypothetical protein